MYCNTAFFIYFFFFVSCILIFFFVCCTWLIRAQLKMQFPLRYMKFSEHMNYV